MKIGILTFHSQLNYGGVLQCWALQQALTRMGHEVVVIDRWRDTDNVRLLGPFSKLTTVGVFRLLKSWVSDGYKFAKSVRQLKTIRFVFQRLHLTKRHFIDWTPDADMEGIQCIVVGSDQVWHCGDWGDPAPYLLKDAPTTPAIAYAVSLGMEQIPDEFLSLFKCGLKRFAALSLREESSKSILDRLGFFSAHCCDPTLLLSSDEWKEAFLRNPRPKRLVCYFLKEDVGSKIAAIDTFLSRHPDLEVDIFGNDQIAWYEGVITSNRRIHLRIAGGPVDFIVSIANAYAVVSDSFHALMFSSIFSINCRILAPSNVCLKIMFSRISEFAEKFVEGPLVAQDFDCALRSISIGEVARCNALKIKEFSAKSEEWLEKTIREVHT